MGNMRRRGKVSRFIVWGFGGVMGSFLLSVLPLPTGSDQSINERAASAFAENAIGRLSIAVGSTLAGGWSVSLQGRPGEAVSWLITYSAVGPPQVVDVRITLQLSRGLTLVSGSGVHTDAKSSTLIADEVMLGGGVGFRGLGVGASATLRFRTLIADTPALCRGGPQGVRVEAVSPGAPALGVAGVVEVTPRC